MTPGTDASADGRDGSDGEEGVSSEQSRIERVTAAVSVAVTLALLGFVAWQAWAVPPSEQPSARVVDASPAADGAVEVTVELVNGRDVGLVSATVEVDCGSPPPTVTFEHVPAGGRATAHATCPSGTTDPTATIVAWQEP